MKNNLPPVLFVISVMLLMSSCDVVRPYFIKNERKEGRIEKRNVRKTVRGNLITVVQDSLLWNKDINSESKSLEEISSYFIESNYIHYNTFSCKAKMHLEGQGKKQTFTGNFRLLKDKYIWVSIQAPIIGEVARVIISPDSVKAMEKINKRVYLYAYKDLQKLINLEVDFNTLQELILGNPIACDGKVYEIKNLNDMVNILIKGDDYINQLSFFKQDSTMKQIQLQTNRTVSTSSVLIQYGQYQIQDTMRISTKRFYNVQDAKGMAELELEINKFEFNKDIEVPFVIPNGYKRQK